MQHVGLSPWLQPLEAAVDVGHEERRVGVDDVLEARMRVDAARTTRHKVIAKHGQELGIGSVHVSGREVTTVLREETQDACTSEGLRDLADDGVEQPIGGSARFGERLRRLRQNAQSFFGTSDIADATGAVGALSPWCGVVKKRDNRSHARISEEVRRDGFDPPVRPVTMAKPTFERHPFRGGGADPPHRA
jgi:hypothetical protein